MFPWRQLGELLADEGLLTPTELELALDEQRRTGRLLGQIVVDIGRSAPVTRVKPGISFLRVMPSVLEPQWTGEIDGEVQNDDTVKTIQYVELGGVVLDAEGNILGGGTGFAVATLPPAARMAMKISNGVSPIPYAKAASAIVSIVPHYAQQTP